MCFGNPPAILPDDTAKWYINIIRFLVVVQLSISLCYFFGARYLDGVMELLTIALGVIIVFIPWTHGMYLLPILIYLFSMTSYAFWALMRIIFFFADREMAHKKYDKIDPWQQQSFVYAMYAAAAVGVLATLFLFLLYYRLRKVYDSNFPDSPIEPVLGMPRSGFANPYGGGYQPVPQTAGGTGTQRGSTGTGYSFPSSGGHVLGDGDDTNAHRNA